MSTKGPPDRFWLSSKCISAFLTSSQVSALALELVHANSRQVSGIVVLRLVLVNFVDWDGGVHNVWLDSLLVDDRLDCLVDVMVDMFPSDNASIRS